MCWHCRERPGRQVMPMPSQACLLQVIYILHKYRNISGEVVCESSAVLRPATAGEDADPGCTRPPLTPCPTTCWAQSTATHWPTAPSPSVCSSGASSLLQHAQQLCAAYMMLCTRDLQGHYPGQWAWDCRKLFVVLDHFYVRLFSTLQQTHCASMWFYMSD